MKAFNSAQKTVSFVFILSVFIYLFLNIRVQRYDILYGLGLIAPPASVSEYGAKAREIDAVFSDYTYRREALINFYSYIQKSLGKEENGRFDIVRSREGYLNYGDFYNEAPRALEEYALRVRRLRDYANGGGAGVIFLNTPPLHEEGYHTYSAGLPYQNENIFMDAMLFFLQGFGVDYIDMRSVLEASGPESGRYRYKTDAHWTVETSFEGFRALVRTLEDEYGESLDPEGFYTKLDNYSSLRHPDGMVGSLGARAGLSFSGRDDFTMLLPNFPTSLSHERNNAGDTSPISGDFREALIDGNYLSSDNLYLSYLGGPAPFRRIVNNNNADGLKILFLCDTFSLPLAAFLSLTVGEVDMIYTPSREVFGYSINIDEYLGENADVYDYILVQLSPGSYSESGFSFFM